MITIGEAAGNVMEWLFIVGNPLAHTFMDHIMDYAEGEGIEMHTPLRYQNDGVAYCKYCYTTHDQWLLSSNHFPPAWMCGCCDHATADKYMEVVND